MQGERNEGHNEVYQWTLRPGGISKEVDGGVIINGEGRGNFLTGHLVEKLKSMRKLVPGSRCYVETFL